MHRVNFKNKFVCFTNPGVPGWLIVWGKTYLKKWGQFISQKRICVNQWLLEWPFSHLFTSFISIIFPGFVLDLKCSSFIDQVWSLPHRNLQYAVLSDIDSSYITTSSHKQQPSSWTISKPLIINNTSTHSRRIFSHLFFFLSFSPSLYIVKKKKKNRNKKKQKYKIWRQVVDVPFSWSLSLATFLFFFFKTYSQHKFSSNLFTSHFLR